jgi:hypothetical protein
MVGPMWMPERLKVWQVLFLVFPLLIWLAWSSYSDFTHLEEEGGVLYVGRTTKLLYELGGKWAVVGFPLLLIGIWGYAIWKTLVLSKRADALRETAEAQESGAAMRGAAGPGARVAAVPAGAERPMGPPSEGRKPPRDSRPPTAPLTPLAAAAPPVTVRAEDAPPDPSGPKLLR